MPDLYILRSLGHEKTYFVQNELKSIYRKVEILIRKNIMKTIMKKNWYYFNG